MPFNSDAPRPVQDDIISTKIVKGSNPVLRFNKIPLQNSSFQKHLGLFLNDKLNFNIHLKEKMKLFSKVIPTNNL